jgi:hypothetical protein
MGGHAVKRPNYRPETARAVCDVQIAMARSAVVGATGPPPALARLHPDDHPLAVDRGDWNRGGWRQPATCRASADGNDDRQRGGEGTPLVRRRTQVALTGGNVADITGASQLLAATEPPEELIADKAYDADHLRAFLQARGTLVVIPNKSNRVNLYPFDADKARNIIERSIGPDQGLSCDRHSL